jgi:hypothetical protein
VTPLKPFVVRVIGTAVFNPSKNDNHFIENFPILINSILEDTALYELKHVTIERYVPYNNVFSSETENITMLIGMIRGIFLRPNPCSDLGLTPRMERAIDWKIKMSQICNKHTEFSNPSSGLDKKFSISLAKHITGNSYEFKTDHEADATCIASIPFLEECSKTVRAGESKNGHGRIKI